MEEAKRIVETMVGRIRFIVQSFEDRVVGLKKLVMAKFEQE